MLFLKFILSTQKGVEDRHHHQNRIVFGNGGLMLPSQQSAHIFHGQTDAVRKKLIRFAGFGLGRIVAHMLSYSRPACSTQDRI